MDQRPGTGRGVGRGIGRGVPPQPAETAPTTPSQVPTETPAAALGRGRGRGVSFATAAPESQLGHGISAAPSAGPSVSGMGAPVGGPGAPMVSGRGRGLARQVSASETASQVSSVYQSAYSATPVAQVGAGDGRALPGLQEALERVAIGQQEPTARIPKASEPLRGPRGAERGEGDASSSAVLGRRPERGEELQGAAAAEAERVRREAELQIHPKPVGTRGRKIELMSNVVQFEAASSAMVYEYRVDFYPQTWSANLRTKLITQLEDKIGSVYLFDFDNLFLAKQLPKDEQEFSLIHPFNKEETPFRVTVRKVMSNRANQSKELLNLIVKHLELGLQFVQIGKNRFNPVKRLALKEGNMPALEIWPGYQTAVNPYMGGILLVADPAFRVIRVGTVKQLLDDWKRNAKNNEDMLHRAVKDNLLGCTVLTPYNNKSYIVSEVKWDMKPTSTFDSKQEGAISFVQYYKKHHNISIKDLEQPMLYARPTPTGARRSENRTIALVPELCQLTGIQDDLRANFNAMKAITTTSKLSPAKRYEFIMEYMNNLVKTPEAQKMMENWGIKIGKDLLRMPGRLLQPEMVQCGVNKPPRPVAENGDWTRDATGSVLIGAMNLASWTLLFHTKDKRFAEEYDRAFREIGRQLGMNVGNPKIIELNNDQNITYTNGVAQAVREHQSEMVVIIFPAPRDDRYAAVKKACYIQHGVASQCINSRTLSKPDRLRAIVQKIAMQINCKLGGYLWRMGKFQIGGDNVKDPLKMMVVGMDTYHDVKRQRDSVVAMVASVDEDFTRWHSRCSFQPSKVELGAGLKISFMSCLNAYVKAHKELPNTIVLFRDGLSDAELDYAASFELSQIVNVCKDPAVMLEVLHGDSSSSESSGSSSSMEVEYQPEIYFIVVQKRINQRLFLIEKRGNQETLANPKPGTVCDEVITRRDMYDFYLVPQNVREGSVSPVHFIVVRQPEKPRLSVDDIQGLAYKLTHMYYNWTGTVKVPAPCMYAHKLAYQSGACYDRQEPKIELADKLFFL